MTDKNGNPTVFDEVTETPSSADVPISFGAFIEGIAEMAEKNRDNPQPIAAGTFVLYPMEDGGLMFVTNIAEGDLAGTKHNRIPPAMIRAVSVLAGGGSKLQALKAMTRRGK